MTRDLILGTAGHIDHGKTALVRALTGTDCDRLPEERARGITIDIGFARLVAGGQTFGVVDVPGHERFVRNMLAGATGFDLALLAVAADDGVMPQTREHLEILQLLGVQRGVVALTKCDAVPAERLVEVAAEVRELLAGTFLESAEIVPTSARTGDGIDALRDALAAVGRDLTRADDGSPFRLAIDRAFTLAGHGTVVTGSVMAGSLHVEDPVAWHRPDGTAELVRVRSLSRHGEPVPRVERGQRAAVNLPGVALDTIARGHELAAPGYLTPSRVLTVRLRATADGPGVKHRLTARLHLGTGDVQAVVSVLDADRADPGEWVLAQLFVSEHVVSTWGQPFVLRTSSGQATLGGGRVLQPAATKLRRREVEAIDALEKLAATDGRGRCEIAADLAGYAGVGVAELAAAAGVTPAAADSHSEALRQSARLVGLPGGRLVHASRVAAVEGRVMAEVARLHAAAPLASSHDRAAVAAALGYLPGPLVAFVVDNLVKAKRLTADGRRVAAANFKPKLSANPAEAAGQDRRGAPGRRVRAARAEGLRQRRRGAGRDHPGGLRGRVRRGVAGGGVGGRLPARRRGRRAGPPGGRVTRRRQVGDGRGHPGRARHVPQVRRAHLRVPGPRRGDRARGGHADVERRAARVSGLFLRLQASRNSPLTRAARRAVSLLSSSPRRWRRAA